MHKTSWVFFKKFQVSTFLIDQIKVLKFYSKNDINGYGKWKKKTTVY